MSSCLNSGGEWERASSPPWSLVRSRPRLWAGGGRSAGLDRAGLRTRVGQRRDQQPVLRDARAVSAERLPAGDGRRREPDDERGLLAQSRDVPRGVRLKSPGFILEGGR